PALHFAALAGFQLALLVLAHDLSDFAAALGRRFLSGTLLFRSHESSLASIAVAVGYPGGTSFLLREPIHIIGGGLAGTEAAWQIARRGVRSILHEMRPVRRTPAHQTDRLAELVCSNSLKSEQESSAPWLLKEELRRLGSLLLMVARKARVPGGHALTVDREIFSTEVTRAIES